MNKQLVDVTSTSYSDGTVLPLRIHWPDGRIFEITRTLYVSGPADHEFEGIRYTVLIGNKERYMYRVGSRWYVLRNNPTKEDTKRWAAFPERSSRSSEKGS